MKKILLISVFLNFIFLLIAGYVIYKSRGIVYLKTQLGIVEKKGIKETTSWYYKNYQHWKETKSLYDILPNDSSEIIFLGNSITFGCEWAELFSNPKIKNRGIGGDNTEGILDRLSEITESKPVKVFIQVGTNDLALNLRIDEICNNYIKIIDSIKLSSPSTKIYVQSVLPTYNRSKRNNDSIIALNKRLESISLNKSIKYLNLFDGFVDTNGVLNRNLSYDGLHLNGQGYLVWKRIIEKEVND